jgi:hydrogenase maturation factor
LSKRIQTLIVLIQANLVVVLDLVSGGTGVYRPIHGGADGVDIFGIGDILRHTSLYLGNCSLDDSGVHSLYLFVHVGVMITRVVDEHDTHDTVEVVRVLVIDGDTSLILEGLTNTPLKEILVELGKKQSVQWSLTLLEGIEVEVITHLI